MLLWQSTPSGLDEIEVFDTATRSLSQSDAVARVRETVTGGVATFKKIDSTMRGNVEAELLALSHQLGPELVLVAPSLPCQGRSVLGGKLVVNGQLLMDLLTAFPCFRIAHLSSVDLASIESASSALCTFLGNAELVVADAQTEEHLATLVGAVQALDRRTIWAGSSGLARALAEAMAPNATFAERTPPRSQHPCLIGVGTDHPVTADQVRFLKANLRLRQTSLADRDQTAEDVLLGLPRDTTADQVASFFDWHPLSSFSGIVLTGGDTAAMFLHLLDASAITPVGEILPGVPWGFIVGGSADGIPVITKSGGFGPPETLFQCIKSLQHRPGPSFQETTI